MDFRYNRIFRGKPGEKGMNKGMHGRGAEDLIVHVPQGTTVKDNETGDVLVDLIEKTKNLRLLKAVAAVVEIFALPHHVTQHLR